MSVSRQTIKKILTFLVLPTLFFCFGLYVNDWYKHHLIRKQKLIKRTDFHFISPLLDVELPEGYNVNNEPIQFENKVKKFVDQQVQTRKIKDISVYFRDLSDGPWFTINESVKYNPASMMKIPNMVCWLRRAEKDPSVLHRKFTFDEKTMKVPPQTIEPEQVLKSGVGYTVEELLQHMIQFSDNRATFLLDSDLTDKEFNHVLDSMNVHDEVIGGNNSISVHGYSGFFRILYNATYLNRQMSEKALKLMSFGGFPYGIIAGVPKGTIVASKFGEFYEKENPYSIQLHEFGIVYHPKGPYILGIMTRGNDWKSQAQIIKSLSAIVYDSVNIQVRNPSQ